MIRRRGIFLIIAAVLAGGSIGASFTLRARTNRAVTISICRRIHSLDGAIRDIVRQSIPTKAELDALTYYREHPSERDVTIAAAQASALRAYEKLDLADCQPPGG